MRRTCFIGLILLLVPVGFAVLAAQNPVPIEIAQPVFTTQQGDVFIPGVAGGIVGGMPPPPGQNPRDTRPVSGTSRIRGRVLVAETMQPARRATVRLSAPEARNQRTTTTDMDGRYDVADLPAGRYSVNATKNGFVGLSYGQTRPTIPPKTVALADKQSLENIDVLIMKGGAITGRVSDEFGDPVSGVAVMVMRSMYQQGTQRLTPFGPRAMTNDIGEYRLFALQPGAYFVAATIQQQNVPVPINNGGAIETGRERTGFAPVFYPGTPDFVGAQRVNVASGQTATEINFPLVGTRLAQLSGVAVDSRGNPMTGGSINATLRGKVQGLPGFNAQMSADGAFAFQNVPPGNYMLRATQRGQPPPPPQPGTPRQPPTPPEIAVGVVAVNGDDVSGIRLAPEARGVVSGRITFDNPSSAASVKPTSIRMNVTFLNVGDDFGPINPQPNPPPTVKDDLTFEFPIAAGTLLLRPLMSVSAQPSSAGQPPVVGGAPSSWMVKSIHVGGVDATNTGIEVRPGEQVGSIEIVMTDRPPEIKGTVTTGSAQPAEGFSVVLFSQDRDLWSAPGPGLSAMARTDATGKFTTRTLRAGRYYALAVYEIEPGAWLDPEFLQNATSRATAFTLGDGEAKTLELRGLAR